MPNNKISVILPVYNTEKYIFDAISSILNQTYKDFELIIIDDSSNDDTLNIIRKFDDNRIRLFINPHTGITTQLNYGIEKATGVFIARMDANDISMPERFSKQINILLAKKDIDIVGTNYYLMDEYGKNICYKKMPEMNCDIKFAKPIIDSILHPSIMVRKSVFDITGKYDSKYLYAEDDEFFLRAFSIGIRMYNIQIPLYKYRITKKPEEYFEIQNRNYYLCAKEYLDDLYKNSVKNSKTYFFHTALLEYYRGDISKARIMFRKSISFNNFATIIRYFPFTLLGNRLMKYLRRKKITGKISLLINRTIGIDMNNIKKRN